MRTDLAPGNTHGRTLTTDDRMTAATLSSMCGNDDLPPVFATASMSMLSSWS